MSSSGCDYVYLGHFGQLGVSGAESFIQERGCHIVEAEDEALPCIVS